MKYICQTITVNDEISTARKQEVPSVAQRNLTINPLCQQRFSPSPSNEFSELSPTLKLPIKVASHFSVKDIAFIDEDVSENGGCMVR